MDVMLLRARPEGYVIPFLSSFPRHALLWETVRSWFEEVYSVPGRGARAIKFVKRVFVTIPLHRLLPFLGKPLRT